ncbi:hypothetical protein, partial [Duncaniella muris]|uniref:hypothetical protein n=1 Tax=Duncaniella muris TaxID=2094150 RepID=UPI002714EEA9
MKHSRVSRERMSAHLVRGAKHSDSPQSYKKIIKYDVSATPFHRAGARLFHLRFRLILDKCVIL